MKIGILTLQSGYNYGGLLQCYALQQALKGLGHDVCVIDYHLNKRWRMIRSVFKLFGPKMESLLVAKMRKFKFGEEAYDKVGAFRREVFQLTRPYNSMNDIYALSKELGAIVVGSDQVWNLDWTDDVFFLGFTKEKTFKKVSYAACFGHAEQEISKIKRLPALLADFDHLSVRNDFSRQLVEKISGRDSLVVADPTLLISLDHLLKFPTVPYEKYILLYPLGKHCLDRNRDHLKRIQKSLQLPIVTIQSEVLNEWEIDIADHVVRNPSVGEWLGLISKATYLMTDSFHGTLLALRYQIPFINYVIHGQTFDRIAFIANKYGVGAGCPANEKELEATNGFWGDFDLVKKRIEEHVDLSYGFLKQI